MVNLKTLIFCMGFVGLIAGFAEAQGPPINTETAFVTGLNGAAFRTFVRTVRKSRLLKDGSEILDPMDREVRVVVVPFVFPYEWVPNRLVVGAGIPYFDKSMKSTQNGIRQELSNGGVGDLSLFVKYQLMQRDSHRKTTRMTFKGGLKLSTAGHQKTDRNGSPFPPGLQLGTGSTDYSVGLIYTHSTGRLGINGDASYSFKTEANGFEFGDALNYNIAFGYRVYPSVYETYPSPYATAYLEANGQFNRKNKANGQIVLDSGGHTLFISPGLQFVPVGSLILEASLQIPVIQDLNGTQLGTDFALKAGIRWLMF